MARRPPTQEPLRFDRTDPWNASKIRDAWESRARIDGDAAMQQRIDDYINKLTGVGDYLQDKTLGGSRYGLEFMVRFLASVDCEDRWRGSDLGAAIVETIPGEMTREGWEVSIQPIQNDDEPDDASTSEESSNVDAFPNQQPPGGADPAAPGGMMPPIDKPEAPLPEIDDSGTQMSEAVMTALEELDTEGAILDALQYERAFGGAAILIGADDGKELDQPLDEKNIKSVDYLNTFQGGVDGEIVAWSYYRDPKSKKYGKPEIFMIRNIGVPTQVGVPGKMGAAPGRKDIETITWVHESRLLIFPGKSPSRRARVQMRGWGDSVFVRVDEVLAQHSQTWGGITALMAELKQDVLSVDGAPERAAADKTSKGNPLVKRARTIQQTKSIMRMLVIDKNRESFERMMVSVGGVSEVIAQFWLRLAAAAGIPLSLLTGQVKGGLGDAGATDIRFFYDRVASAQRRVLVPLLKKLVRILMLASEGPTEGVVPERWTINCLPLYRLDAMQEATRRKTIADTDVAYINAGVLNAPEVTASAFGGSDFSAERTIDLPSRKRIADEEAKQREQRMKDAQARLNAPPEPKPEPKPVPVSVVKDPPSETE